MMTMHRMVAALYVLDQANENDVYDIIDRKKKSLASPTCTLVSRMKNLQNTLI